MMKQRYIFLLITLIISLILSPNISAFQIKPSKAEYLVGETFQAEVTGNFTSELKAGNIYFYSNGDELFLAFHLIKVSDKQYFIYVDLPYSGNYSIIIKNIIYKENDVLKGDAKQANFTVKETLVSFFNSFSSEIKKAWPSSVEENAYALIALSYDSALASQGRQILLGKSNDGEFWPSSCNVKDTSLALFALLNLKENVDNKWFLDSQNNLDIGLWDLAVDASNDSACELKINNENTTEVIASGLNTLSLDLSKKPSFVNVSLSCPVSFTSKIVHTYLGTVKEFPMNRTLNETELKLDNEKCFGQGYRSACDAESTAYALFALNALNVNKQGAIDWLKKNAQTTKHKAILTYFGSSEESWLVNNQHNRGYWSNTSLLISQVPDFESTVFASLSLEDKEAGIKGKEWIKQNFDAASLKNKALALALLLRYKDVEAIVAVSPAFIKTETNKTIEIELKNNGIKNVNVSASFFSSAKTASINSGDSEKISFQVPKIKEDVKLENIELKYPVSGKIELNYLIPVLIFSKNLNITNQTIDILPSHFIFTEKDVNAVVLKDDEVFMKIHLKNFSPNEITNITLTYTRDIARVVNITPLKISKIDAGKTYEINFTVKSSSVGNYSGVVEAKAGKISASLPVNITVTKNESLVNNTNQTPIQNQACKDLNGTICSSDESCTEQFKWTSDTKRCCISGNCEKNPSNKRSIGLAMLGLAVIVIIIFLLSRFRKPKKATSIIDKLEQKYAKKGLKQV